MIAMLQGLGVNSTVGPQLVIFLVSYLLLYFLIFKPYFRAYTERVERTMGRTELAERYISESHALQSEYEAKARELSANYKTIFDDSRGKAMREYDKLIGEARQAAKAQLDGAKDKIKGQMSTARKDLEKEVPAVSAAITSRLLGKELVQ